MVSRQISEYSGKDKFKDENIQENNRGENGETTIG